jgi:hypothetical protein
MNKEQRFWKQTYRFMDNVKTYMDDIYKMHFNNLTEKDVEDVITYIQNGINGIIKTNS